MTHTGHLHDSKNGDAEKEASVEIVFFWVIFAILVAVYAEKKGRSGVGFFFLAVLLSPLIAFIIVLIAGENRPKAEERQINSGDFRKCPFCAELIKPEALVCKHCGRDLPGVEAGT
jgi:hypothetical protein